MTSETNKPSSWSIAAGLATYIGHNIASAVRREGRIAGKDVTRVAGKAIHTATSTAKGIRNVTLNTVEAMVDRSQGGPALRKKIEDDLEAKRATLQLIQDSTSKTPSSTTTSGVSVPDVLPSTTTVEDSKPVELPSSPVKETKELLTTDAERAFTIATFSLPFCFAPAATVLREYTILAGMAAAAIVFERVFNKVGELKEEIDFLSDLIGPAENDETSESTAVDIDAFHAVKKEVEKEIPSRVIELSKQINTVNALLENGDKLNLQTLTSDAFINEFNDAMAKLNSYTDELETLMADLRILDQTKLTGPQQTLSMLDKQIGEINTKTDRLGEKAQAFLAAQIVPAIDDSVDENGLPLAPPPPPPPLTTTGSAFVPPPPPPRPPVAVATPKSTNPFDED